MPEIHNKATPRAPADERSEDAPSGLPGKPRRPTGAKKSPRPVSGRIWRVVAVFITVSSAALAIGLGRSTWRSYIEAPWTRDATVRAYVVDIAPEVSGRIVALPVGDNGFVHKGAALVEIDPTDYNIDLTRAGAVLQQAQAEAQDIERQTQRREDLAKVDAVALEQLQLYQSNALVARAKVVQAAADLHRAQVNLSRTRIVSPVNGWVTNLLTQRGDFANAGQSELSIVDSDSFWVDAYFEESQLVSVHEGDPVSIDLIGYHPTVLGHVESISRGINVGNAQANPQGLATVNPIFTWVRLAQRIPVRIHVDRIPPGVRLVAGLTATVHVGASAKSPGAGQ